MTWPLSYCTIDRSPLFGQPESLVAQARAARAAGFRYLTPDVFSLRAYEQRAPIQTLADELAAIDLPVFDISGINIGPDRAASLAEADEFAGWAQALGAQWVQSRVTVDDADVRDTYRRCASVIGAVGCGVAIEFSPFTPINSVAVACEFVHAVRDAWPRQGVVVDTWHLERGGDGVAALAAIDAEDLVYVQINDALPRSSDLRADTMNRRAEPGAGELPLGAVVDALVARDYRGVLAVEVLSADLRALDLDAYVRRLYDGTTAVTTTPGQ